MKRRKFIKMVATGLVTPLVAGACQDLQFKPRLLNANLPLLVGGQDGEQSYTVFGLSVASGDPSPTGIILWTHINESAVVADEPLVFQVSLTDDFTDIFLVGEVDAADINSQRDFTVSLDLDGQLIPNTRFYYRFIYNNIVSRTGRCRTLPIDKVESLKFAVITCQDYTNGYYGAYNYIAADDEIDYVIHLGDFIYESAGDPRFQSLPFSDRAVILPSGGKVALGLEDYRQIYQTIRSDRNLQLAAEQHSFIMVTDDHEIANDCYWDYDRDTLGAPDHPFVTDPQYDNDVSLLRQLKLDSQKAWAEYTPARIEINELATHPHDFSRTYRNFKFGDLVDLFMLDTRTYRTPHPCGEGDLFNRYAAIKCDNAAAPQQSMLGDEQRQWLFDGLLNSNAIWPVLGNQTFMSQLHITNRAYPSAIELNMDAWDGYKYERNLLLQTLRDNGIKELVVLTGDLHSYIATELKIDFNETSTRAIANYVGTEFMTPSMTSAGLSEILLNDAASNSVQQQRIIQALSRVVIQSNNPHIKFFDSTQHGYSTIQFNNEWCEWRAFVVDKNNSSPQNARYEIFNCKKYQGIPWLL